MANPFYQSMVAGSQMMPPMAMSQNPVQALLQRASQIYQTMNNPQELINQYFPFVPESYRNDPDKVLQYLQQTGKVTPQQITFLNQFPRPVY